MGIQNLKLGQYGIHSIEDYTDGYMSDGNLVYIVFNNKKDFKHIFYKEDNFFTEIILKFNKDDILEDFFINGDDLPLQYSLVEIFKK